MSWNNVLRLRFNGADVPVFLFVESEKSTRANTEPRLSRLENAELDAKAEAYEHRGPLAGAYLSPQVNGKQTRSRPSPLTISFSVFTLYSPTSITCDNTWFIKRSHRISSRFICIDSAEHLLHTCIQSTWIGIIINNADWAKYWRLLEDDPWSRGSWWNLTKPARSGRFLLNVYYIGIGISNFEAHMRAYRTTNGAQAKLYLALPETW